MENEISGLIFKVKRFSVHDGPGIRTAVFLKGCPLKCAWCHSPEGISSSIDIWHNRADCIGCSECIRACTKKALSLTGENKIEVNRNLCTLAGNCTRICPTGAISFTGHYISLSELMDEVKRDVVYYRNSGGGITVTGGEPLLQPAFTSAILKACNESRIHTAIETCLYCEHDVLTDIIPHVSLFIVDLKINDPILHELYTGHTNELIRENFKYISECGKEIIVRIPIVKGITDNEVNTEAIIKFVNTINSNIPVEFLAFNPLARNNYERLGMKFPIQ